MTDDIAKKYFECAGDMLNNGFKHLQATDPKGFQAVSHIVAKGATISLITTISGNGSGGVKCTATLDENEVLLFVLDAQSGYSH
jgi:hypothetical protein